MAGSWRWRGVEVQILSDKPRQNARSVTRVIDSPMRPPFKLKSAEFQRALESRPRSLDLMLNGDELFQVDMVYVGQR
jgi:hypothetical protein